MSKNVIIGIAAVVIVLGGGYFLVSSMNATPSGTEATSTVSTSTDQNPAPSTTPVGTTAGVPSVLTSANIEPTNSTAVVTGSVTPNGAPTTYWYEYGQSAALGNKTPAQSIGSGFSPMASPAYIIGLSANTTYYFRLDAQNSFGMVSGATYSFGTNNNPPGQGNPPSASTNAASSITSTAAVLNAHLNPRSSATTFWFEYGENANFGSVTGVQQGGSGNASIAVSSAISGLNPLTKYYFRVNEQNQYGTVNGSTMTFTTTGPAASAAPVVTTQMASPIARTTATLRGTVNPGGVQTTYWFEYGTNSILGSLLGNATAHQSAGAGAATASVQSNISNLQPGTTYYYQIVAQSSAGIVRGDRMTFSTN